MNFQMDSQKKQGIITINGEISLQHAKEIKDLLSKAIDKSNDIIIDLEKVSYIDLSFFQLLFAAQQKCKHLKKNIFFSKSSLDFIKKNISEAGFSHSIIINGV